VLVPRLHGTVVTLAKDERFAVELTNPTSKDKSYSLTVDGIEVDPTGSQVLKCGETRRVDTFTDTLGKGAGDKPFIVKEVAIVEGQSLRAMTAAADAMDRAGKISCRIYEVEPCAAKTITRQIPGDALKLETTVKKALLNGLGAAAPTRSGGSYTFSSSYRVSRDYGTSHILYRDRCAVLLWLGGNNDEGEGKKRSAESGGGGGGGGGGGSSSAKKAKI
jgi:hypothetical protein